MSVVKGSNASAVKQHNRSLILNLIAGSDAVSRAELSRATGLSKGGITPIINELLDLALILESRPASNRSGRNPILLTINPGTCAMAAIDWRRTGIQVALTDSVGTVTAKEQYTFTPADTPSSIAETAIELLRPLVDASPSKVIGIGVVTPGPIDRSTGCVRNPPNFHGWQNIPVRDTFHAEFGIPVLLENNANAYGVAEKNFGRGKDYNTFMSINVDDGIGSAIILNKQLYLGMRGLGNEFGHVSVDMNGAPCHCGSTGCVEMYASLPRLLAQLETSLDLGAESSFYAARTNGRSIEWSDVLAGLEAADSLSVRLMHKEAEYLGCALVAAINLIEPEAVILGSQIADAGAHIVGPLEAYIRQKAFSRELQVPDIFTSDMVDASLSGGAAMVFEHFVDGDLGTYETVLA